LHNVSSLRKEKEEGILFLFALGNRLPDY